MELDWTQDELAQGLEEYRSGEFFAAHELWEAVWLTTPEPGKSLLQALIQTTVAFHHRQRGNLLGTTRLLERALQRLESYPAKSGGIAVDVLRSDIRVWLNALGSDGPTPEFGFPRIRILP